ncbi:MAG: hypothetical protein F4Y45_01700 [Acidobacteria bacterium]|nr:hypothetical protein [Acidobacteriota bacterium]MYD71102.1 hypothetical protein [Acidobacteriota bacterium]MYJ04298.1 hypothetical protein [Acidobacteriota bacterium]
MRTKRVSGAVIGGWVAASILVAWPALAAAQEDDPPCRVFCTPDFKVEPTFTFEPLGRGGRVQELDAAGNPVGPPVREATELVPELILALGIPTEIPRIGFTLETIFTPAGQTDTHPFTGASGTFRDNGIEFEFELNIDWLTGDQTGGWVESHFDIVDKFSSGERPGDPSVYTHKLNFELDTAFLIFNWLPEGNWLKGVEVEGSLDYVATGLPRAGDVIGNEMWLDDASPWGFSIVLVFPMAPL